MTRLVPVFLSVLFAAANAVGDVRLPAIISDHMVLQRDAAAPIWGWADAGEKVTVRIGGQICSTITGKDGRWRVDLEPMRPGHVHTLSVTGAKNELTVKDVLIGDVWLGSGQSNMAMNVASSNNPAAERAAAHFPRLRMFTVTSRTALEPQDDCRGTWAVCSPATVAQFSATAYFFGRELLDRLNVPIGLINSSVGGTPIESWTSLAAQKQAPRLAPLLAQFGKQVAEYDPDVAGQRYAKQLAAWEKHAAAAKQAGKSARRKPAAPTRPELGTAYPGALFNGKIAPLIPFAIKGAIWYQGERNSGPGNAELYRHQLPVLITDWRERWQRGPFPFAWVQLPNFETASRDWPTIRESMLLSLAVPHTGMAIAIDVGDPKDIHPKNKQAVGHRLAQWALGDVYGFALATSGPLPAGHRLQGAVVRVDFRHADGGLELRNGGVGFEIADNQGKWHPAKARIEGAEIVVSANSVKQATGARYAWANNPEVSLYNGAGLPATPFRIGTAK